MHSAEAGEELPLVMAEIAKVMSARGTVLTLHPDDDEPQLIYRDEIAGLTEHGVRHLMRTAIRWDHTDQPDVQRWTACDINATCYDVMIIPVTAIPRHSRLFISVFFEQRTADARRQADAVYTRRAPFAIGYFRLWQMNRMRERELGAMRAALNLTEMGIMLVDRSGQMSFANRTAKEMLRSDEGLRVTKGYVRATRLRDSVALQMAIEHVIAANATLTDQTCVSRHAPMLSIERTDRPPLVVSILPVETRATEPHDVAAIIYALDPTRNVAEMMKPVCKIFGLSPVETRLTCLLAGGAQLGEAAKQMRVKEMTARSYLKQIFLKTNTHRQTELMQLMLSSVLRTAPEIVVQPLTMQSLSC